jgi:hypothetical protein
MSGIFGILGLSDNDRSYVNTIGQSLVFTATQTLLQQYNADLNAAMSIFLDSTTTGFKERYKLPGGGRLQRRGGLAQSAAVKAYGSWDVAFPLEDFGAQLADSDIAMAYMTMPEYNRHVETVMIQDMNTVRFEMLKALFNSTAATFVDPINGSLTIERLANGDSVVYPPVLGSETEATDNHYLESNYAATAISDTNNPYITIREELEEHFGASTGGDNIVVFINNAETPETEDLSDFDAVPDNYVRVGSNTDVPQGLPTVPGKVIGRTNGVWVVEWRWMPANYMFGIHLDAPRPLKMRVDPADTGLGTGLQLVARDMQYPIESAHYRHRFGFGCANRLNGVVMELGTGGSYSVPAAYA